MDIRSRHDSENLSFISIPESDKSDIRDAFDEPKDTFQYCSWTNIGTDDELNTYYESRLKDWELNRRFEYLIFEKDSRNPIGTTYFKPDDHSNIFTFGLWIKQDYWGNNYSSERADLFLNYLFTDLNAGAIRVGCLVSNKKSLRSISKYIKRHGGSYNGAVPVSKDRYNQSDKKVELHHEFSITQDEYFSESSELDLAFDIESDMQLIGIEDRIR